MHKLCGYLEDCFKEDTDINHYGLSMCLYLKENCNDDLICTKFENQNIVTYYSKEYREKLIQILKEHNL